MNYNITIRSFGHHAVLIEWPNRVEESILDDILGYIETLKTKVAMPEWELVPAYNSLTMIHRNGTLNFLKLRTQLLDWYKEDRPIKMRDRFLWRLPVCYDFDFGIDLLDASEFLGMETSELITMHTAQKYTVYGIGFLPGFMYLGGLPKELEVPRKSTPRLNVAKGAVGLAAKQTGIYPQDSPGGWNIIGNCAVPIFDATAEPPCFVSVGDKVQFYAIERAEYELHLIEAEVGIYKIEKIPLHA